MNIVLISKAFVRDAYQRKLEEMASIDGVSLTLISPPFWRDGGVIQRLTPRFTTGYRLLVTPIALNGHFHLHFYPGLPGLLRTLRPDLVHVDEEPYNLATWLAIRAARDSGAKAVFFTWQNLNRRLPLPFSLLEAQSYRRADGAIAGNRDAEVVLRTKGFRGPIWIIPQFGIDPDLFRPADRADHATFTVGYVGRLVRAKGVDVLLRACPGLDEPWRLVLVGDGAERSALERLAHGLGIRERVEFRGEIPSTEIPRIMGELDVLVVPSRSTPSWREQFGRVLVEAMACGVPPVGSDSGEIPHVIGDAGFVFPEEDWRALGDRLLLLQRDPERRRWLGEQGRQRALALYSQRRIAEQTVTVYREVLGR